MIKHTNQNFTLIKFNVFCVVEDSPLTNVYLELHKENLQQPEEGLSDANGEAVFKFKDGGIHHIRAEKQGYFPVFKTINLTKAFLESGHLEINIPMIRDDIEDDHAIILLSSDSDIKGLKLHSIS